MKRNEYTGYAVVDKGGRLVAQSWDEQFLIFTARAYAKKSTKESTTKLPGEKVVKVRIIFE